MIKLMMKVKPKGRHIGVFVALCVLAAVPALAGWSGTPPLRNTYNEHEFLAACRSGNLAVVRFFLGQQDFNPDRQWPSGRTGHLVHGLFLAAQGGHEPVVQELVDARVDLDKTVDTGITPLLIALFNEHASVVQALVRGGADVDCGDHSGLTPLMVSVGKNDPQLVSLLLENNARVDRVDAAGVCPLVMAASMGSDEVVDLLLTAGARPTAVGQEGRRSPLQVAAAAGHCRVVDQLLAAGVQPALEENLSRTGPLVLAASAGHAAVVRSLARAGACVAGKGAQALAIACYSGHNAVVDALLDAGVSPNASYRGVVPLAAAASCGFEPIVASLLQRGADSNCERADGTTPLFLAANRGATGVVRTLLQAGARADRASSGITPLFAALLGRHHGTQQVLVESGRVDLCQPCHGLSPLDVARVMRSRARVIGALERAAVVAPASAAPAVTPAVAAVAALAAVQMLRRVPTSPPPEGDQVVPQPSPSVGVGLSGGAREQEAASWIPFLLPAVALAREGRCCAGVSRRPAPGPGQGAAPP